MYSSCDTCVKCIALVSVRSVVGLIHISCIAVSVNEVCDGVVSVNVFSV